MMLPLLNVGRPIRLFSLLLFVWSVSPEAGLAQRQADVERYLVEIDDLAREALEFSRRAEAAGTMAELRRQTDAVFQTIWGISSGLADENARGSEAAHGWKTRWQVTYSDFDSLFAARYGSAPPEISDPSRLGIVGRGRFVRAHIESLLEDESASEAARTHGSHVVASLNNVIGWMKMDDGVTKGERQPRVDLTREWDSPIEFWMSTADTGWLHEVYAQALNILKTDYGGDLATALDHAAALTRLVQKAIDGTDANGNGSVEPVKMEGGIATAVRHAHLGGLIAH